MVIIYRQHFRETKFLNPRKAHLVAIVGPYRAVEKVSVGRWPSHLRPSHLKYISYKRVSTQVEHRLFALHLKWFSHLVLTLAGGGWLGIPVSSVAKLDHSCTI